MNLERLVFQLSQMSRRNRNKVVVGPDKSLHCDPDDVEVRPHQVC